MNSSPYKQKNKDFFTVSFAYVSVIFTQIFSLIFVDIYLWYEVSPALLIIEIILTIFMLYNLIICHCIDPGILKPSQIEIPESNKENLEENVNQIKFYTERYCKTCKIMRPPKASHCRECDFCVKGFDHHCFFVGNCIGIRNWGNFINFLFFTSIQIIYRMSVSIVAVSLIFKGNDKLSIEYGNQLDIFIGTFVCVGLAILVFFICSRHPAVYIVLIVIAMIFLIAGSAKALENVSELKYYEYPIFSLINLISSFPFLFWLIPMTIANFCNASLNITTKERNALMLATVIKPDALDEKKKISNSEKILNLLKILFAKRPKSEIA